MSFHEVQFPPTISYGSRGGPGHNTSIVELDSGAEERIARWTDPRCVYDVGYGVKSYADLGEVLKFVRARQGATHGFRFKDWSDYTSASDGVSAASNLDVTIGVGDGVTATFQLVKTYTSGGTTRTRRIEKPVSGTTVIAVAGTGTAVGWTVNTTTGLVTFTSIPTVGQTITAGFQFDVPVRFGDDVDQLIEISLDDFSSGSIPRISAVEIKNEVPIDEDFLFRGSQTFDPMSANIAITPLDGCVLSVNPTAGGLIVNLPDPSAYSTGGPYFFIQNLSGANTVAVQYLGVTIITIPVSSVVTIVLGLDAASAKLWIGF